MRSSTISTPRLYEESAKTGWLWQSNANKSVSVFTVKSPLGHTITESNCCPTKEETFIFSLCYNW